VINMDAIGEQAAQLQREWATGPRWAGITRDYSARDVIRLRGHVTGEHRLARQGARRLWDLLHRTGAAPTVGAVVADGAAEAAGGWQTDDGSFVADAGSGAGLGAFELMTAMIEAGAAGVRFDDQLSADGARGDLDGKILVPTGQHIETLTAARLAADVLGVPSLIIARSVADAASLLTSDRDERDHEFLIGERTTEGLHRVEPGWYACVTRQLAFAPYADVLWLETPEPDLAVARAFACVIHSQYPDKLLAYSCRAPFTGRAQQDAASVEQFQLELAAMGYQFQSAIPGAAEPSSETADRLTRERGPVYA
jgi:isocitrate lyase